MTATEIYAASQMFFPPPPAAEFCIKTIKRMRPGAGVYFLYDGQHCVYVGESVDVRKRLSGHEHLNQCDGIGVIWCESSQRKRVECFYIGLLDPRLNHQHSQINKPLPKTRRPSLWQSHSFVLRKTWLFLLKNPGASLTEMRKCGIGWRTRSKVVRDVIRRLEEWGFVGTEVEYTNGRPKVRIYPKHLTPAPR
jgi:hypothetical protein